MRLRFSLRSFLLAIAFISVIVAASLWGYRQYVVGRTPLEWKQFHPERLETIADTDHPILISPCELDRGLSPDLRYYLEYTRDDIPNHDFRRFIHNHKVELLMLDYTLDDEDSGDCALALHTLLHRQYPELPDDMYLVPEFVLALPGRKRLIIFPHMQPTADDVTAAILSGSVAFDPDEYAKGLDINLDDLSVGPLEPPANSRITGPTPHPPQRSLRDSPDS
jgi:hypothetical protein